MKKTVIFGTFALVLAGCASQVPDSGQGVGFNDFAEFELDRARREAELRGQVGPTVAPNGAIVTPNASGIGPTGGTGPAATGGVDASDLAAAGIGGGPVAAGGGALPVQSGSNGDISDEQDFGAVSARESIESDAQRRERQAAAYQLIEVTDLPDRNGNTGPNIVQYALQAPNNLGESVFNRTGFNAANRFARNCAKYRTPDEAQRDFISRGGPQRDRLGLDPDGDGFACGWDPQPFRTLASGN
ncbi:hypothetical protein [Pseudooctadecabacter jejudonensis]|uniref:Excalibur calcium-binding domain-containing protein n=1 Tax=Pseudooctadecabacter jejudonensis TaxID=1391910 RepID=A0A1Y5RQH8_9RHOB|nr:hypothetical protein [Pseudooctadecabacter jejudonensis]SLN22927.1 hypothetical protein PSJ8397_00952 [Pseudooctadecabacter jejudonensis]